MMPENSSKVDGDPVLALERRAIGVSRLRAFLTGFANLEDRPEALSRFYRLFFDMLPPIENVRHLCTQHRLWERLNLPEPSEAQVQGQLSRLYIGLRDWLRSAWVAKDKRARVWLLHELISNEAYLHTGQSLALTVIAFGNGPILNVELGPPTPFEQAAVYLLNPAARTRVCNNADCPAPYFLADKRNQMYCSEDCALPAQRQFKRLWWQQNGKKWRKNRERREKTER
jgi:hypothetical protein